MNACVFAQHESSQKQASRPREAYRKSGSTLSRLNDNNTGFCFWVAGTITFITHEKDPVLENFSCIHGGVESS